MRYAETVVRESAGGEKKAHVEYGFRRGRRPSRPDVELNLVVVKGLGQEPSMLLTNVAVQATRRSVWGGVSGYLTRWRVAETIRCIQQSYRWEALRGLDDERLRNPAARVRAAAYCAAVWLGESLKLAVLATRVSRIAKRCFGGPEFHYYALADGLARLLSRLGQRCPLCRPTPTPAMTNSQRCFAFG